jgi:hypothetical protein
VADRDDVQDAANTEESYAARAMKQGPLPHVDDDSPLVGEDDRPVDDDDGAEHDIAPITIPAPGAGSYPVPSAAHEDLDEARPDAADDAPRR